MTSHEVNIVPGKKSYRKSALGVTTVLCGLVLSAALPVWAEPVSDSSPWEINADRVFRFSNPDSIVAEGNVVMIRKNSTFAGSSSWPEQAGDSVAPYSPVAKSETIKGDWVRFDPVENMVKVRGNVSLDSEDEQIKAEAAVLDLDDHTGTLSKATLYFPQREMLLAGETVEKTGELTYHFEDGWATKCETLEGSAPPWSFAWKKADLTAGGFAHFRHVTFRVKDYPLAYSPYFSFPTNQERKTGLLLPELSHSGRDGVGVVVPLFLDLSPSYDLTLYGGNLSQRGNFAGAEFRYVLDEGSKGSFALNYLRDRLDDSEDDFKDDGLYRATKNRYWFRGKIDHDFDDNLGAKLDLDLVSDRDYLQEYQDGRLGFEESEKRFVDIFKRGFDSETTIVRTNVAQMSKLWTDTSLNAELRTVNDPTDTASTSHLWSLPKVIYAGRLPVFGSHSNAEGMANPLSDMDLAWNSEYIYYWREDGVGSQRLDMHPRLVAPLRLTPYLETTVSAGLRETLYHVDDNGAVQSGYDSGILDRTMQDYNITTSTIFMRDFGVALQGFSQLTHMVRPEVSYDYIPSIGSQDEYPNLDSVDRIVAKNLITYTLRNDFDLSRFLDGTESSRKYAFVNISQSYNLIEDRKTITVAGETRHPLSVINFDTGIHPFEGFSFLYKSDLDTYGRGFTKYSLRSVYSELEKYNLGLEYRYEKDAVINQLNGDLFVSLSDQVVFTGDVLYSFETDKTTEASLGIFYSPECWSLEFLVTMSPDDDYRFSLIFSLEGIGKVLGVDQTLYVSEPSEQ